MKFSEFELHPEVLEGIEAMSFDEVTPVQEKVIPLALEKKDVIACAQTGTGKTAAYLLPLLHHIKNSKENKVKALILATTRELVQQIDQQFQGFSYFVGVDSVAIYGGGDGAAWDQQRKAIEQGAHVLIASPGRIISHLNLGYVDLSGLEYFIIDEADKMLDMGFLEDLEKIVKHLPKKRQTMLFSATMPSKIRGLANKMLNNPAEINIALSKPAEGVLQAAYLTHDNQKNALISHLLVGKNLESVIIFVSTKLKVKSLVGDLQRAKFQAKAIHSDLAQSEREEVMLAFRNRKFPILVATDIVSRGIDIDNIELIINYDCPQDPEDYVHRVGRTARAKSTGVALTFINQQDMYGFSKIETLIETEIQKIPNPPEIGAGPEYNPQQTHKRNPRKFGNKGRYKGKRK